MPTRTCFRALLVFTVISLFAGAAAAEDWNKTFAVSAKPDLHVETNDGHIAVSSWDRKEISVRVTTEGWRIAPGEVQVVEQQSGNRVSIEVKVPRMHISWGLNHRTLRVDISMPREATLDLHSGDGHINVTNVRGDMRLVSGDGHITGDGLEGSVRAHSGDGRITLNGRFDLLDIDTGDGSIEASARPGSVISAGNGWRVHTGDGHVTLRLPSDFKAQLDAHTGDGSIHVEFPITVTGSIRKSEMRGSLNGGGAPLTIRTGDGSIRVERL